MSISPSARKNVLGRRPMAAEVEVRWLRETVESLTSLAESVHFAEGTDANEAAFAATRTALTQIEFRATAFAVPDGDGLEFRLQLCDPPGDRPAMNAELAFQVSKGRFGWALRQGRPVVLAASEEGHSLLLHPLATRSRVIGVFMGLMDDPDPVIPLAYRKLTSLAFFHFASVIECADLSHQVQVAKELLSKRSAERAESLRHSEDLITSERHQATRMLEELGRELQTSASTISGMASGLLEGSLRDDDRDTAKAIFDSAGRIGATLCDLATWCHLDSGAFEFGRQDFDPTHLVSELEAELSAEARSKGIALISRIDPELPYVLRGDPDALRQILSILAGAAVAASDSGEVSIRVHEISHSRRTSVVRFDVQATGAHLDPRVADAFFDPFGEERSLPQRQERGMRLALCRRLVEGMQGQVGVVALPGTGTRFWCNLQLEIPADEADEADSETGAPLQALLLCSEGTIVDRLKGALERRGHQVLRHPATNDLPDPARVDILILGSLVDGGGWAHMCRRFRRLPGGQSVVILALAHQADVEGMLDAGADDCLLGTMDDASLEARIAVAERAARRMASKPTDDF